MTRVIIGEDCGNSPKNVFLQKFTIAFAEADTEFILNNIADEIRWNIVGDKLIEGKVRLAEALHEVKNDNVVELTIHHIATHGKAGAVDGTKTFGNGRIRAFCDMYEFSNAKASAVKEIISYVIEIK